jgi:16S rRNA (uracil1498-N3)-methyltransferase
LDKSVEIPRFHHNPLNPGRVQLSAPEGRHFVSVLRGRVGQSIELFDGCGRLAGGVVTQIKKNDVFVEIENVSACTPSQAGRIILAVAAAKGQRLDWMLSKCTELGADHIVLIQYEHSVRLGRESAAGRYQNIIIAACKQSGRVFLPTLTGPQKLADAIAELKQQYPQSHFIFGSPDPDAKTLRNLANDSRDTLVFIGPEGGLTQTETQLLEHNGAVPVRVANHILRTETAAAAFTAILEALRINNA